MSVDQHFVARVRDCLGDAGSPELSPTGRTLVRYPGFVVSPEGSRARPVAARIVDRGAQFAVVNKSGVLDWTTRRPLCSFGYDERLQGAGNSRARKKGRDRYVDVTSGHADTTTKTGA